MSLTESSFKNFIYEQKEKIDFQQKILELQKNLIPSWDDVVYCTVLISDSQGNYGFIQSTIGKKDLTKESIKESIDTKGDLSGMILAKYNN